MWGLGCLDAHTVDHHLGCQRFPPIRSMHDGGGHTGLRQWRKDRGVPRCWAVRSSVAELKEGPRPAASCIPTGCDAVAPAAAARAASTCDSDAAGTRSRRFRARGGTSSAAPPSAPAHALTTGTESSAKVPLLPPPVPPAAAWRGTLLRNAACGDCPCGFSGNQKTLLLPGSNSCCLHPCVK